MDSLFDIKRQNKVENTKLQVQMSETVGKIDLKFSIFFIDLLVNFIQMTKWQNDEAKKIKFG